ncbi:hypothetical protein [Paenibacillus dakarensis]|uniref:hypothetical protein n=1 Tax=Paenibacillus dakarensis TaxID=1527293 RepID=UPI001478C09C|nr:hypothetical protein [Paenibacillus dakarensis]
MIVIVILAGCGSKSGDKAAGPATMKTEGKIYEQDFGSKFEYYRTNAVNKVTSRVAITLSAPEVVKERTDEEAKNSDTDYVKVFVKAENVGDGNSTDMAIRWSSFKAYDANGKEISTFSYTEGYLEDEFEPVELRPGGKNEGFMYIPILEGEIPAEIIYFDSTLKGAYTNQFVFKL